MKYRLLNTFFVIIIFFHSQISFSQNTGELMFVGFNADAGDGLSVVALVEIPANTTIFFTDNAWDGSVLATNEGTLQWDTGGSAISPGTVVNLLEINNGSRSASIGSITSVSGSFNISAATEVVLAYLGTATIPSTFLSAIGNNGLGNLSGTGLTDGVNATNVGGSLDVAVYDGPASCNGTIPDCAAEFADGTNWIGEGGSNDQSNDGGVADFPASVPAGIGGTALPVELISFSGKIESGVVVLSWETASESNNDYFEIRRSFDGKTFEAVAVVNGNGTVSTSSNYQYVDQLTLKGTDVYYQLKQVDFDGNSELFSIIYVSGTILLNKATVYPNPAINEVTIRSDKELFRIDILDYSGRIIRSIRPQVQLEKVDISELQCGQYLLQLYTFSGSEVHKLLKQ